MKTPDLNTTTETPQSERPTPGYAVPSHWVLAFGAVLGVGATLAASYERLEIALHPGESLFCDVSSKLSCSSALTSWQGSVFGIPNCWIALTVFALFASAAVAALTGSQLARGYLWFCGFFALFMLGFSLWYLWQTAFAIGALCMFCILCGTAVVIVNAAVWRMWRRAELLPRALATLVDSRLDVVAWVALWVAVAIGIMIGLNGH